MKHIKKTDRKPVKRLVVMLLVAVIALAPLTPAMALKYDPKIDYYTLMVDMANKGDRYSLYAGQVFEKLRNEKIDALNMKYPKTDIFTRYSNAKDIQDALVMLKNGWTPDDFDLMCRIVNAEAGCDWIPDWVQRGVASVVVNRVKSTRFPNTVKAVIYQPGQYGPAYNGSINLKPTAKSIANAKYVLMNGPTMPAKVIGQNDGSYGTTYKSYYDPILGTTMCFTY